MASLIMHLIIADQISSKLTKDDKGMLLLGSIATDGNKSKISHCKENSPYFDYGHFMRKYWEYHSHPYFIGYLSHLIADDIWQIYRQYKGIRDIMAKDEKVKKMYYDDFVLLNAKLLKECNRNRLLAELTNAINCPDIDEVSMKSVLDIKKVALTHFEYPKDNEYKELNVLSLNDVSDYMKRAVYKVNDAIKLWQYNREGSSI